MPAYKVVRKPHRRTTRVVGAGGVINAGVATTYFPGDVIEDLSPHELQAFPDRFIPATDEDVTAFRERQKQRVEPFLGLPDPTAQRSALEEKAQLEHQIAALQAKLSALPVAEPDTALREHAPVDPATLERHQREQEAIRQVTQEQGRQELPQQGATPDTTAQGGQRPERNKADEDDATASRGRRH